MTLKFHLCPGPELWTQILTSDYGAFRSLTYMYILSTPDTCQCTLGFPRFTKITNAMWGSEAKLASKRSAGIAQAIWGIHTLHLTKHTSRGSSLVLKLMTDNIRRLNQGPTEKDVCPLRWACTYRCRWRLLERLQACYWCLLRVLYASW